MAKLKPVKSETKSTTECWSLLWAPGKHAKKLKLKIIDVVLFEPDGTPSMWLFTSKEGTVKRKSAQSLNLENVYKRFVFLGSDDVKNSKTHAAVAYLTDGEQVPISAKVLSEILLTGPKVGRLKSGGKVRALRAYIHQKGGHGSGFRNTFKTKDRDHKAFITSTQRLLPLTEQVSANKKVHYRDLKSTATKLNSMLDRCTGAMVKFLEDEQKKRCWYVEADYVVDQSNQIWVAHFEQIVYSKLKLRNDVGPEQSKAKAAKKRRNLQGDVSIPKQAAEEHPDASPAKSDAGREDGKDRLPTPGAFVCPGDFCNYGGEDEAGNATGHTPWTTDKAIERERQALQETISAYRRTMSETSALGNAILSSDPSEINVSAQRFAIMNKSILHGHEPDAQMYMSEQMRSWKTQCATEAEKEFKLEVLSPPPGKSLSSSGPINIRWKNIGSIPYVRIQLYCGWAVSTVVTDGLPNEGFAVWRPGVEFRRREAENLKALGNAQVWRFKVSCASRPHVQAFSKRFALLRLRTKAILGKTNPEANTAAKRKAHELQVQMEEEERFHANAAMKSSGMLRPEVGGAGEENKDGLLAGVLANAHPVDHYYREVQVCKNCYNCYTTMDRRREKGTRRQFKHKGGVRTGWAKRLDRQRQRLQNQVDNGEDLWDEDASSQSTARNQPPQARGNKRGRYNPKTYSPPKRPPRENNENKERNRKSPSKTGEKARRRLPQKGTLGASAPPSFGTEYKKFRSNRHPGQHPDQQHYRKNNRPPRAPSPVNKDAYYNDDQTFIDSEGARASGDDFLSEDSDEPLLLGSTRLPDPPAKPVQKKRSPHSARSPTSSVKAKPSPPKKRGVEVEKKNYNAAPHRVVANFVNRVTTFVWENFDGQVPMRGPLNEVDQAFVGDVNAALKPYLDGLQDGVDVDDGILNVVRMSKIGVKYLMDTSYWQLVDENRARCATIVTLAMDLVLLLALTLEPYVPLLADQIQNLLNVRATAKWIPKTFAPGIVPSGHELNELEPLYAEVPNETLDAARDRVKNRLLLAEKRRKKREKERLAEKVSVRQKERGWGMPNSRKKSGGSPDKSGRKAASQNAQLAGKVGADSPVYRTAFPGWGLNPTPTPRSKKREEMKAARKEELKRMQDEKNTRSKKSQRKTDSTTSAADLLGGEFGHDFADPPDMPRPNVDEFSSAAVTHGKTAHGGTEEPERFEFSKSSLRQALWMGRSAIAKFPKASDDIDMGLPSTQARAQNKFKASKARNRSLPALERPGPSVTPYLSKATLAMPKGKHKKSPGKKKKGRRGAASTTNKKDDLLSIGPMPRELHARSGLRQVVSLLVLGQLNDIRLILNIAKKNGLRVLAHCRSDGDQLVLGVVPMTAGNKSLPETPPGTAKLLREFLLVGTAFNKLFEYKEDGKSYLVHGARELSHGLRSGSLSAKHMKAVNRAVGAIEKFNAWVGVGASRSELLKGVAAWQSGQAGVAHHHWMKAVEAAVAENGELAYDAAVARFLIGKHNESASAYVAEHALEYLSQADALFARLGQGSETELEAVRAEIERVRGGRPKAARSTGEETAKDTTGYLSRKEMESDKTKGEEQVTFITRPPTAIQETLNWGRKSLDVIKRRLHNDRMLPLYHPPDQNLSGSRRAEQMDSRRQGLAKALVIAEGQLAALEAEVKAAISTGSVDARPTSAMQFTMERKLIKLIDEVSARASELTKIDERESKYLKTNAGGSAQAEDSKLRYVPHEERIAKRDSPDRQERYMEQQKQLLEEREQANSKEKAGTSTVAPPTTPTLGVVPPIVDENEGSSPMRTEVPQYYAAPWRPSVSKDPVVQAIATAAHGSHKLSPTNASGGGEDLLNVLKTQLIESAENDNLAKLIQVLATKIVNINTVIDEDGNTTITLSARNGCQKVVEYCANHCGEGGINAQNFEGNTALHYAYERKDVTMSDILIKHGANAHLKNMYGLKAMSGAKPRSFSDFAAYAI
jgi:hypothetical protein